MTDLFGAQPNDAGGKSKPKWPVGSTVTARFGGVNDCYRYDLTETWDRTKPTVMFLMMNPSVAGIGHADPTLIKTGKYARTWGFGGQLICNVHAYRATDSAMLAAAHDPVGPDNDLSILDAARRAQFVVLAYGQVKVKSLLARGPWVVRMLAGAGVKLRYLRLANDGTPYHPLYLPGSLVPIDYNCQVADA